MCLKSFNWNSHSIKPKLNELSKFTEDNKIDIIFLSETWLKDSDTFYLPLFDCYRADRPRGGVALLIRKAIPHTFTRKNSLNYAESVSVKVLDSTPFTVTSIYCSPATSKAQAANFYESVLTIEGPHIIAGDFNAKHVNWNNTHNCTRGKSLIEICSRMGFKTHSPDNPTTYPPTGPPSTLDIVLSKQVNGISDLTTLNELSSDHLPVVFEIPFNNSVPKDEKILNFKKADWKKFKLELDVSSFALLNSPLDLKSTEGIDDFIGSVNFSILKATKSAVPLKSQYKPLKTYSEKLNFLIRHRNQYRNAYKRSLNPSYKSMVSQLNKLIRKETCELKNNAFNERLSELCVQNNSLWQFTKTLKNKKRIIPPLKRADNTSAYSNDEKAEAFAKSFLQSHLITADGVTKNDARVKRSIVKLKKDLSARSDVENTVLNAPRGSASSVEEAPVSIAQENAEDMRPVTGQQQHFLFHDSDLLEIIKHLNVKKASGPDDISNRVLKNLPITTIKLLTKIFNACMKISYFPLVWKIGKIIPIAKPNGDSSDPKCYRPISLLSNIGKIFERLILEKLQSFEALNKIFIKQQFGFRSEHSTVHQVLRITEDAALGFNNNKSTGLVTLDLEKAFDSVWHDGLLHKLSELKTPLPLLGIISSYLNERQSFVVVEGKSSSKFTVPAGVPQGSILSPHLFNIFINDIPLPKGCEIAIYADDTAIFCKCSWKNAKGIKNLLCTSLYSVSKFFESWRIKINASKTKFIVFSKSTAVRKKLALCPPSHQNEIFQWQDCITYLGVDLDHKLLFRNHIEKVVNKANGAIRTLYCIIKRNSQASEHSKISVYRSVIRPIMTYACIIFNNCAKTHLNKLQVVQNKCLRMILNADFYDRNVDLHDRARIPTIRNFIDKLTKNFYERSFHHENDLISNLGKYTIDDVRLRVKHRLPRPL
jgi:endonuclease/exonuclease/phosphatase family metal-dependent hydrolase